MLQLTKQKAALALTGLMLLIASTIGLALNNTAHAASSVGSCGRIDSGGSITSPDGHYITVMQSDGNLVTYVVGGRPLWATGTNNNSGAWLSMQCDGNLVVVSSTGRPLWASGTNGNGGAWLSMQNDANLVVVSSSGQARWASGAVDSRLDGGMTLRPDWAIQSPDRRYRMVMQGDGNLVVYGPSGPTWASGHANRQANSTLEMQGDGNLVVYGPGHVALWASGSRANYPALVGQNDGNFVIYGQGGVAVWGTASSGGSVSGTAAQLARQILDLRNANRIIIADYSTDPASDRASRSLASQQLEDIAAGLPARLSTRCGYSLPYSVAPDPAILQFLADLGQQNRYTINVLFGQCHSGPNSSHHRGKAVDFSCNVDVGMADRVGPKYGVSRNFENCANHGHWHYSVGGV